MAISHEINRPTHARFAFDPVPGLSFAVSRLLASGGVKDLPKGFVLASNNLYRLNPDEDHTRHMLEDTAALGKGERLPIKPNSFTTREVSRDRLAIFCLAYAGNTQQDLDLYGADLTDSEGYVSLRASLPLGRLGVPNEEVAPRLNDATWDSRFNQWKQPGVQTMWVLPGVSGEDALSKVLGPY